MTAFEELGVMPEIGRAVEEMDWSLPTDVQAEAIPMILGGGDVLMAAETGSGKTGAFCLPVIQIVHETMRDYKEKKSAKAPKLEESSRWKFNAHDRDSSMAIDTEGLLCQSRDMQGWSGSRTNRAVVSKGKYYYEAVVTDEGLCRVGWSTSNAKLELGLDKEGFGFGGTGKKSNGRQFDSYGEAFSLGDIIGCFLDLDSHSIHWSKNGVEFPKAYSIPQYLRNMPFYGAVCLKNAEMRFNFGDTNFKYKPSGGFQSLSSASKDNYIESNVSNAVLQAKPPAPNAPSAIIIEPSRELAEQTYAQVQKFKKHLNEHVPREMLILGGMQAKDQIAAINNGVDIVVGTPGRLDDLISSGKLVLSSCRFFILDEADGLISQGHLNLIERLHGQMPKVTSDGRRLQMIVCSATLHSFDVKKMATKLMHFPTWIDLKGQDSVPETVHHVVLMTDPRKDELWKSLQRNQHIATDQVHEKDRLNPTIETPEMLSEAVKILKGEYTVRAIRKHKMDRAIIFCRTKVDCDNMERYLNKQGGGHGRNEEFSCVCLHGSRKPDERRANLAKFKDGRAKFLICTDVAARGLDITGLPYVINVTLPDEKQNYVHRIGRVGRAERMGLALSFVSSVKEKVWYHSNCNNGGRGCYNTQLTDYGGCCIWYNEPQYLADIEDHLGVTIDQVGTNLEVPVNEFDGKVTYGKKQSKTGSLYKGHVEILAPAVKELASLEKRAQSSFINLLYNNPFSNFR